ncbi:unnamed protein product [Ectocarpus sp. CCAP 1310/34]|nr:unnamed protein product [Ectocarpus sp. CCAP 1310/34]
MDPYHFHIGIAEKTAEQLATNAELLKDGHAILVPFAAKFMEDERLISLNKHVKSMGLGTYLVQEHGKSQYGNRVIIVLPDTEGNGGRVECTCRVPTRFHLLCQDALAVLKSIDRLDCTRALIDSGYTLASFRVLHTHPDYPVVLPIWSELSKGDLLPPRQVTRQAGAPKKNRGPRQRSRFPGRNDNCQRGRGNVAQDGGTHPDYPVVLPIWSELSKGDLLPPRQVTRQAGAPKKNRGPRQRSRFSGRNDNCQRGRGNVAQDGGGRGGGPAAGGGGGRGGGGNSRPVPVHGMGSVGSHVGDLNVGGSAGERTTGRLWGGLAVQRYGSEDATGRDHASGAGAGSCSMLSQSQGSIDLS